ncbi:MAG: 30S ribosomal protein S17 [Phycisphaerae bacterium]|jgi:small subunit ribosomal protein S17
MTEAGEKSENAKPTGKTGVVESVSGKMTVRVTLETLAKHPQYGKYLRHRTRLAVHDPKNEAQKGDLVEIVPCRRLSKNKSWRLLRVVRKSTAPEAAE